ncbi:tRNA 5-hydroxyuridine modification protein YegQ [Pseudidiomarina sp. 1APR75-33.1]|uniref:prephenate-dependent tRNA uridine(34) hydroxylase TrhP n=1 Tax=Pseudidiomarina terrestris TaxID=2820060 RepID=UPI002653A2FB|nr:tRNA 5-hydroxyuridine modification protein YegQ [Pseudidiomarina sp. 1APR75-33.1]MDN7125789.1 tRNA 5-hydroxyuridine modification protein YegQ [Pseudidiomarina sp. 1APR75-33.1]
MSKPTFSPELLSPAGSLEAMRMAFAYGADAVYAGQPRYSLRVRNNSFDLANLAIGIAEAHAQGKKFYVVVNIAPHNAKLKTFVADMAPVIALQPDALIVSDPGIVMLLREHYPEQALHLSVQANTVNWAAVKFWQQQGVSRVILSRELEVKEIAEIRHQCPDMELEVFVHGALCMAYSGRCLLSGYINKRDPNQGACTNACRWPYQVHDAAEDAVGQFQPIDRPVLLEEPQRPGELMLMDEDIHGTYIMNSKDLRGVQHVQALAELGIHSLKIEGRTKSPYYVARTAQVYRQAIADACAGRPFDPQLLADLDGMANRGFTEGFLRRHVPSELQNYQTSHSQGEQVLVGAVLDSDGTTALIDVKNSFASDDNLILMKPSGNIRFRARQLFNRAGEQVARAPGSGHQVSLQLPCGLARAEQSVALLVKELPPPPAAIAIKEVSYASGH